ncbi:MAG: S1C family serine protease [Gemmatimonadota bacterium]|nr:S1C family serine protease [Gemmatimonadota bacterium]
MRHPMLSWTDSGRLSLGALLWALLAAPLALAGQEEGQTATLEELAAQATRSVVLIDVQTPTTSRQGSGFIVDQSGRILTNQHVIRDVSSIRVKLASGDVYDEVHVLATDERRDLAILQIAGFRLPALDMGDSDEVRIGTPVVLIGSPLGLENTVTTGIVSGRRQEPEGFQLLQMSAPASKGSSGGPLMTLDGRVVGIASSQMNAGQNLNFALPINYARGMLSNLGSEPVAVYGPSATATPMDRVSTPLAVARAGSVNHGLTFDLSEFQGYAVESESRLGDDRIRRTRITYRIIETLGRSEPRLERYSESETTRRTEPFGTHETLRRDRTRTIVSLEGFEPVSTRGETTVWTGETWRASRYDLRFEDHHVRGLITTADGSTEELDRDLPLGIVLREFRDLAFGALVTDSLVGRSVELATFDPWEGEIVEDRYDVIGVTDLQTADNEEYRALVVNVASGLFNATAYFQRDRPRILLRQEGGEYGEIDEVRSVELFPPREGR